MVVLTKPEKSLVSTSDSACKALTLSSHSSVEPDPMNEGSLLDEEEPVTCGASCITNIVLAGALITGLPLLLLLRLCVGLVC